MNEINQLINHYGDWFYLITFIWAGLEGETFVLFAGFAAYYGYLNIEALVLSAWLGSFCGDQVFFWLGRYFGQRIFEHFPKFKPGVERALGWLEHYAVIFILTYRFMYGVRNVSGVAIGLSRLRWQKFAFWNFIAAFIWAIVFSGIGYFFGDLVLQITKDEEVIAYDVRETLLVILGLFIVIFGIKIIISRLLRRHEDNTPHSS